MVFYTLKCFKKKIRIIFCDVRSTGNSNFSIPKPRGPGAQLCPVTWHV